MNYSPWLDDIYKSHFFPPSLLFLPWTQLWAAQLTVRVLCAHMHVFALWLLCCSFSVPAHELPVPCLRRQSRSPAASHLYFPFYAEMRVWSQQVYNKYIKDLRQSWEEGRRVHSWRIVITKAQCSLWASTYGGSLVNLFLLLLLWPVRLRHCKTQTTQVHSQLCTAATMYRSSQLLWDLLAMPVHTAPLRLHRDQ